MTSTPFEMSFDSALSHEPSDKRIEVLRLVGQSGSISQAARDARISYKAAWQAIDTLTNLAGVTLVDRAVGGSGGGGARLTAAGARLLEAAALLGEARASVLDSLNPSSGMSGRGLRAISGMGLRTSMRNQLPCEVHKLELKSQLARVHLRLGDHAHLVSQITRASAQLLALRKGQRVLALFKATAVAVSDAAEDLACSDGIPPLLHCLTGRAARVSPGMTGDEITMELAPGLMVVGFARPGIRLRKNQLVQACIREAAVVVAIGS
jgi:molybdate transport system regulatory protein